MSVQCEHLHTILCKPFLSDSFSLLERNRSVQCAHTVTTYFLTLSQKGNSLLKSLGKLRVVSRTCKQHFPHIIGLLSERNNKSKSVSGNVNTQ